MERAADESGLARGAVSRLPDALGMDELLLVWRQLVAEAEVVAALHETLSAEERAAAARYHFERDRVRSILSRGTLRAVLAALLGRHPSAIELVTGEHGKPALRKGEIAFNVSHADRHLLIGLCRARDLGVDVEGGPRPIDVDELAPTVFTPQELAALGRDTGEARQRAFLRAWTRKEAYLKARSVGLSLPLTDFSVSLDADEAAVLSSELDPAEAARFVLRGLPAPAGYEAAACWSHGNEPVRRLCTLTL